MHDYLAQLRQFINILLVHRRRLMRPEVHASLRKQGNSCAVKYENNYKPISQKYVRNKFTFYEQLTICTLQFAVLEFSYDDSSRISLDSFRLVSAYFEHTFIYK